MLSFFFHFFLFARIVLRHLILYGAIHLLALSDLGYEYYDSIMTVNDHLTV